MTLSSDRFADLIPATDWITEPSAAVEPVRTRRSRRGRFVARLREFDVQPSRGHLEPIPHRPAPLLAMFGALGAVALELAEPGSHAVALAVVAALTWLQLISLQRSTGERIPLAWTVICVLNVVGVTGYYFYDAVSDSAFVSARLATNAEISRTAAGIFVAASLCTWVGALCIPRNRTCSPLDAAILGAAVNMKLLLAGAVIPLALAVIGRGSAELVARNGYGTIGGPLAIAKVGQFLLAGGLIAAAIMLLDRRRADARPVGFVLVTGYVAVYFASGSRGFGSVPLLLIVSAFLAGRRPGWKSIAAGTLAAAFLFQLPLALRTGPDDPAGLAPYARAIVRDPHAALLADPSAAVGNVLFAVPLAGTVAESGSVSESDFLTSINPLPGHFTNWESIKSHLRVNYNTPYSALGELAARGTGHLLVFFLFTGALLSVVQRCVARLTGSLRVVGFLAASSFSGFFAIDLLQYNLRSAVRFLVYLSLIVVAMRMGPLRVRRESAGLN